MQHILNQIQSLQLFLVLQLFADLHRTITFQTTLSQTFSVAPKILPLHHIAPCFPQLITRSLHDLPLQVILTNNDTTMTNGKTMASPPTQVTPAMASMGIT